jgi:hypothetical protein
MVKILEFQHKGKTQYQFKCPACNGNIHALNDTWKFNNDFEKPTFKPSVLVKWNTYDFKAEMVNGSYPVKKKNICHSFITDGKISYCGDCTHDDSGKTLDLLEFDL